MNIRRNPNYLALADFLTERGIKFNLQRCSKHPTLFVEVEPPLKFARPPGTSSDQRSALNGVRDLKRLLAARGSAHA